MKEMSKEELLEWLDTVTCNIVLVKEEQAYKQIRKLIEGKPKVTREFVEEWVVACQQLYVNNCGCIWNRFLLSLSVQLKGMLQDAGVEVEE